MKHVSFKSNGDWTKYVDQNKFCMTDLIKQNENG